MASIVEEWAWREMAAWRDVTFTSDEIVERLIALDHSGVCLFEISDGQVAIHPRMATHHPHMVDPHHPNGARAGYYLALLRTTIETFDIRGHGVLGIYVNDEYLPGAGVPLFFFQKPVGARGILLPDLDFLIADYFSDEQAQFYDAIEWTDKDPHAVFVGSTTGTHILSAEVVAAGTNPRLRSAARFRGRRDIQFHLPRIVQTDTPETTQMIVDMGVAGKAWTWQEQFGHRYLLSIDGNGATCSRVAIALGSRSALVKYHSDNVLFYFHGLEPWRHYIPVRDDADLDRIITGSQRFERLHARIAHDSRLFHNAHLCRIELLRYTALVLSQYLSAFGTGGSMRSIDTRRMIDSSVHIANVGTRWTTPFGWAGDADGVMPIEGFSLVPGPAFPADDIRYRVIGQDGSWSRWHVGREFCGTVGQARTLHGVDVQLSGQAARAFRLTGELRFADGSVTTINSDRPSPAPLTGFRLNLLSIA